MTTPTTTLTNGPCSNWVDGADISNYRPDISEQVTEADRLDVAAAAASDLMYVLSGRKFTGACQTVIRPVARARNWSMSDWANWYSSLSGSGWSRSWGSCGGGDHDGCSVPPQVDLGVYPIVSIDQVKIDGIVIPPAEYGVDGYKWLVRRSPTASATPTARYGWPTCQDFRLPDTQPGTFSVAVTYGMIPPPMGLMACATMAAELALSMSGLPNRLPARVTNIIRQGVAITMLDPMQFLQQGKTGIYEVDLFLASYNPDKQQRRTAVLSPDFGTTRRATWP